MSAPATNAFSPAPVRITTRTPSSRLQLEHRAPQLVERRGVQRVEHLRAVDRDDRDRAVALEQQVVEGHGASSSGNGYISQPSTTADARKPANISAAEPHLLARLVFARCTANTSDTKNANSASSSRWLCIYFRPMRDVVRVDDDQQVQQAGDDQERVAVLVGDRAHVAAAVAERAGDEVRQRRCRDRRAPRGRPAARTARTETGGREARGRSRTSAAARRGRSSPFDRRPSHRWPAPGMAHDARHSSTSAARLRLVRQQWRARSLVYLIIRGCHDQPRDDDAERQRRQRRESQLRRHRARRPLVDQRERGRATQRAATSTRAGSCARRHRPPARRAASARRRRARPPPTAAPA